MIPAAPIAINLSPGPVAGRGVGLEAITLVVVVATPAAVVVVVATPAAVVVVVATPVTFIERVQVVALLNEPELSVKIALAEKVPPEL